MPFLTQKDTLVHFYDTSSIFDIIVVGCCIGLAQESPQEKNLSPFVLGYCSLCHFFTKIDAKTASTTVSDDNQLAMGLIETTEWLIVGWSLCKGHKMLSMASIMLLVSTFFVR